MPRLLQQCALPLSYWGRDLRLASVICAPRRELNPLPHRPMLYGGDLSVPKLCWIAIRPGDLLF